MEKRQIRRIFYAMAGAGDLVESHRRWKLGEHNPSEVSITFSSQIEDFSKCIGAVTYLVSPHQREVVLQDGDVTIEHRPKKALKGILYHLNDIFYGINLVRTAVRFRADVALIDSGCTHYFVLGLFRLFGISVIPILHNTIWPAGFRSTKLSSRIIYLLDALFWRFLPQAVIAVSPECERQLNEIRGNAKYSIFQIRAQFNSNYFNSIAAPPSHKYKPFRVMFIGRVERSKGVFDILEIARQIEDTSPELVRWEICGGGKDLEALRRRQVELDLQGIVNIRGWISLSELVAVYDRCHASIVPTTSSFAEGLAMTAAEAILAGRPVITNPVVPALEVLRPACVEARTDDVKSYVEELLHLANDEDLYLQLCRACPELSAQFYDRSKGLSSALRAALC
jgi:glycogen synthase